MPTSEMRAFAALYAAGDETIPQRKAVLLQHRQSLAQKQEALERCRAILDRKLARYDDVLGDQA